MINNGAESLFEVQYSGSTEYDFWAAIIKHPGCLLSVPRNSGMVAGAYGWNLPTEEFVKQYEDGDLRKDITVLYQGCPAFDGMEYKRSWFDTVITYVSSLCRKPSLRSIIPTPTTL